MSESVLIVLPLAPACLSPNKRPHYQEKRRATAGYRKKARIAAEASGVESGPWQRVTVRAAFFFKQNRRRDDVNHLAMLKPAYDGLVDAGLIEDDDSEHLSTLTPTLGIDKECPRVELQVVRIERNTKESPKCQ